MPINYVVPLRRSAILTTVAAAAIAGVCFVGADAGAGVLPDGFKRVVGGDGRVVQMWRIGERAQPITSVANNGAGRAATISGKYRVTVSRGGGNVQLGYLVGCQVQLGDLTAGATAVLSAVPSVSGSISLPLAPGQVVDVANVFNQDFATHTLSLETQHQQLDVQGCGGYAQARSYVRVIAADGYTSDGVGGSKGGTVSGSGAMVQATLFGAPFSLG
ncbi:hypothetical protein HH308_18350 [Gordonia sp. TBRC 11910]|uniref:MspA protein n=1 Tax=Gordonia asplenii TaxID=2725283 RepID=A0A848L6E5_9ACTN|nr:MspA family porin [Gordonia asplenii]NMO03178.1 hypothetical protein [Gordonia asplenii]